jgi:hypothetical protein
MDLRRQFGGDFYGRIVRQPARQGLPRQIAGLPTARLTARPAPSSSAAASAPTASTVEIA